MAGTKKVLFGPAGWSYADWNGIVYPPERPRGFDELRHIARYFDAVELNVTFYRPASPNMARSWLRRTAEKKGFQFTAKLNKRFTHEREDEWSRAEADEFKRGVAPLAEAGRLGGLLVQFPWSFKDEPESRAWLEKVFAEFGEFPLFLEVRHDSWRTEEFFDYLHDAGVGFVNIDQPLFGRSLPPTERVTGKKGYVRLHGRNYEAWFAREAGRNARYDYLYNEDELAEWVGKIRDVAAEAETVFVIANNHYRGQAAANSLELRSLFEAAKVAVPESLMQAYPRLERIAAPTGGESQGRLV